MNSISQDLATHPVEIREADGQFVCLIPTLFLTASAPDPGAAYQAICAKRDGLVADAQAAGVADRLFPRVGEGGERLPIQTTATLASFTIRVGVVAVALALLLVLASAIASTTYERAAYAFVARLEAFVPFSRGWDQRATNLEEWLYEAAEPRNQPTPAQEAKIRASLHALVMRLRPYVDEITPLFDTKRPATAGDGPPK